MAEWRSQLRVGLCVDVANPEQTWVYSVVTKSDASAVMVKYLGWPGYGEPTLPRNSDRLAPPRSRTRHVRAGDTSLAAVRLRQAYFTKLVPGDVCEAWDAAVGGWRRAMVVSPFTYADRLSVRVRIESQSRTEVYYMHQEFLQPPRAVVVQGSPVGRSGPPSERAAVAAVSAAAPSADVRPTPWAAETLALFLSSCSFPFASSSAVTPFVLSSSPGRSMVPSSSPERPMGFSSSSSSSPPSRTDWPSILPRRTSTTPRRPPPPPSPPPPPLVAAVAFPSSSSSSSSSSSQLPLGLSLRPPPLPSATMAPTSLPPLPHFRPTSSPPPPPLLPPPPSAAVAPPASPPAPEARGPACPVCLETFDADDKERQPRSLACGHSICHSCIVQMAAGAARMTCPICRAPCPTLHFSLNHGMMDVLRLVAAAAPGEAATAALEKDEGLTASLDAPMSRVAPAGIEATSTEKCSECAVGVGVVYCESCDSVTCRTCVDRIHSLSASLRRHAPVALFNRRAVCKAHDRPMELYCTDDACKCLICLLCTDASSATAAHVGHRYQLIHATAAAVRTRTNDQLAELARLSAPWQDELQRVTALAEACGLQFQEETTALESLVSRVVDRLRAEESEMKAKMASCSRALGDRVNGLNIILSQVGQYSRTCAAIFSGSDTSIIAQAPSIHTVLGEARKELALPVKPYVPTYTAAADVAAHIRGVLSALFAPPAVGAGGDTTAHAVAATTATTTAAANASASDYEQAPFGDSKFTPAPGDEFTGDRPITDAWTTTTTVEDSGCVPRKKRKRAAAAGVDDDDDDGGGGGGGGGDVTSVCGAVVNSL